MTVPIEPGDRVLIRDSQGHKHPGTAESGPERGPTRNSFVRVRVRFDADVWREFEDGVPWPADAVRPADGGGRG